MNSNREIADAFVANRYAKNASMTSTGWKLRSYATAIAEHTKGVNGEQGGIAVNTVGYSVTTKGKHYPALIAALVAAGYRATDSYEKINPGGRGVPGTPFQVWEKRG